MLTFATALTAAGIDPAAVRLLRHHKVYPGGRPPPTAYGATIASCSSSTSPRKTPRAARISRRRIGLASWSRRKAIRCS